MYSACVCVTDVCSSVRVHSTLDGFTESQTHRQRWMFPKTWKSGADSELTNSLSSSGQPWQDRPTRTLDKRRQEHCRCTHTLEPMMQQTAKTSYCSLLTHLMDGETSHRNTDYELVGCLFQCIVIYWMSAHWGGLTFQHHPSSDFFKLLSFIRN